MGRFLLAGLLFACGADALAQGTMKVTTDASPKHRIVAVKEAKLGSEVGELHINGHTVFRFRGTKGGDPYTRAQVVAGRMNADDMANLQPKEVEAKVVGGYWAVVARDRVLITADMDTARVNRTSPDRLAKQWAAAVRKQLAQPPPVGATSQPAGPS